MLNKEVCSGCIQGTAWESETGHCAAAHPVPARCTQPPRILQGQQLRTSAARPVSRPPVRCGREGERVTSTSAGSGGHNTLIAKPIATQAVQKEILLRPTGKGRWAKRGVTPTGTKSPRWELGLGKGQWEEPRESFPLRCDAASPHHWLHPPTLCLTCPPVPGVSWVQTELSSAAPAPPRSKPVSSAACSKI